VRVVTLNWHGPYRLDRLSQYGVAYEKGIYSIYRTFNDNETLMYIGKTEGNFMLRLTQHDWWVSTLRGEIRVRLGVFIDGRQYNKKTLADVESLLITWHKPVENTLNIRYYYGRELAVVNKGRRGSLQENVSTANLEFV
jgi:hypothetical protein